MQAGRFNGGSLQKENHFIRVAALCLIAACVGDESVNPMPDGASPIVFTEITLEAGLADFEHDNGAAGKKYYAEQMGSGGGFLDYDGDGWLDILLMGGGQWDRLPKVGYKPLWLYRNKGDGTFVDVTSEAGLDNVQAYTIGMAAADFDNDGDSDFVLTNINENMLFRNDGGRFTEIGRDAGLAGDDEWSSSPLFIDADRDGWLDLYIGNYAKWTPETDKFCPEGGTVKLYCIPADYDGKPSRFFRNNGDGTFSDQTVEAGILSAVGKSLGAAEFDYDRDGWSDFLVANDGEGDLLYHNAQDGTFRERGVLSGIAFSDHGEARAGMGIDVGVVDDTGEPTMFVGNFSEETVGVYRHIGGGLFQDRAAASRIGQPSTHTLTFGLFLFDVDLDGDLDLFTANGHVYPDRLVGQDKITYRQRSQLYMNSGDGTFEEAPPETTAPLAEKMVARGAAYGDYDRDGDLDILISENDGPVHLWRNDSAGGNYLRVSIEAQNGNRDGLGTRVVIWRNGKKQERRIHSGSSYLSQSEMVAVFGLGDNLAIDSMRVVWASGADSRFGSVQANQEIRAVEGSAELMPVEISGVRQ